MTVTEERRVSEAAEGLEASPTEDFYEKDETYGKEVQPFKSRIVWKNLIGFAILHIACLYGIWLALSGQVMLLTFIWSAFLTMFAGCSVTLGAHRLWSHKSYKATPTLKTILLIGQTIAGQNCLWVWVRDHRQHHKYSDTDADPHNSTRGFWFSHIGWLMMKKHPEVIAKGKLINMADIEADPLIMFQKKYYKPLYFVFAFVLPIVVPWALWGESLKTALFVAYFGRYMIGINVTWCVNSVAHIWGTRPYNKNIAAVESPIVSFLGQGEGWHNYHHAFPWDCNAAEFGMHYNTTGWLLQGFERLGLAYDLRYATRAMVDHKVNKYGDGTWVRRT